jgi:hypothetical protein
MYLSKDEIKASVELAFKMRQMRDDYAPGVLIAALGHSLLCCAAKAPEEHMRMKAMLETILSALPELRAKESNYSEIPNS